MKVLWSSLLGAAIGLSCGGASVAQAAAPNPNVVLSELQAAKPDLASARRAAGLTLPVEMGSLTLEEGVVVPATPVAGAPRAFVFVGKGRFKFTPPDAVERRQLALYTGGETLDEPVTSAVIETAGAEIPAALATLPAATVDAARSKEVRDVYAAWNGGLDRKHVGVETLMLAALVEPRGGLSATALAMHGATLGDFHLRIDPTAREQVSLGQWVQTKNEAKPLREIEDYYRQERRLKRLPDHVALDFAGADDVWVSASLRGPDGKETAGVRGFAVTRCALDATLDPYSGTMTTKGRLSLEPLGEGRRAARFALADALRIKSVRAAGRDVFFRQRYGAALVVLPEAPAAGAAVELEIEYAGNVFDRVSGLAFARRAALWYPTQAEDRPTFDVTFRYPKSLAVVAGGRRAGGGVGADGLAWERRETTRPSRRFDFEVGAFRTLEKTVGHVTVRLALDARSDVLLGDRRGGMLDAAASAVAYYEKTIAPYPLDELTVVSSLAGNDALGDPNDSLRPGYRPDFVSPRTLRGPRGCLGLTVLSTNAAVSREIARQWWGEIVDFAGPRDEWLGEALSAYAALAPMRAQPGISLRDDVVRMGRQPLAAVSPSPSWPEGAEPLSFRGVQRKWKVDLAATPFGGARPLAEHGALAVGRSAPTSFDEGGAWAIPMQQMIREAKGALVLGSLAAAFPDDASFLAALSTVATKNAGRAVSTEEFLAQCGAAAGTDLGPLARPLIDGVGLPEVFYDYEVRRAADGKWIVSGAAEAAPPATPRLAVRRTAGGAFDVTRVKLDRRMDASFALFVPIVVETRDDRGELRSVPGKVLLRGARTEFSATLDARPERVIFDPDSLVCALFRNMKDDRKPALAAAAGLAADRGESAEARRLYAAALEADIPMDGAATANERRAMKRLRSDLDARARIELLRLDLDEGRLREAEAALAGLPAKERAEGEARLRLLQGRPDLAYKALAYRRPLIGATRDDALTAALLAAAAKQTDHLDDYERARRIAVRGGADLSPLQ